jgi:hypothetical protein
LPTAFALFERSSRHSPHDVREVKPAFTCARCCFELYLLPIKRKRLFSRTLL